MAISTDDVPLSYASTNFPELAAEVHAGAEKIISKNGESYIALIDAKRLDYYRQLERERISLLLILEVSKALDDVASGKVYDARVAIRESRRLSRALSNT